MAELKIEDMRANILDYAPYISSRAGLLYEFFEFWPVPRNFHDPARLADCFFFNIHISSYVKNWVAGVRPPADPSTFSEAFPSLLKALVREGTLTLCVKSPDPESFNAVKTITAILQPQNLSYMLLRCSQKQGTPREPFTEGVLFFEWPITNLEHLVDNWFGPPQVTIEGYISSNSVLPQLAQLFYQPDTEERLRELLRAIEIGFKVWQDFNGMFLLTERMNYQALNDRLQVSQLNEFLRLSGNTDEGRD